MKGRTLRDWISEGFFADKNKYLNSKRILNCVLQIAVGLNYIHKRGIVHQEVIPDYVFVENDRILKIGHLGALNPVMNKFTKNFTVGGSPEYWSPEQGGIFDKIKEYSKDGNYSTSMKLLPVLTYHSDLYQLGLIICEILLSDRLW